KHDSGWVTAYAHLGSITVRDRQRVARGQQVGLVGQSGRVDAPQLHFQIRHFRQPVNPLDYLPR
ncbi:MAG: M23 family metallopeptidase, partial [Proteobacteria bacterium]|nr:M23 family metallopeptidase [Pseudomonadota bacterium]